MLAFRDTATEMSASLSLWLAPKKKFWASKKLESLAQMA
jgi:hypothetical protein